MTRPTLHLTSLRSPGSAWRWRNIPKLELKHATAIGAPTVAAKLTATFAAAAAISVLAGCANYAGIGPKAQPLTAQQLQLASSTHTAGPAVSTQWWEAFGDDQLNTLVTEALANNPSLRVAQSRLARAQAAQDTVRGVEGPQVAGSGDLTRQLFTSKGIYPPPLAGSVREVGTIQVTGTWELDFFGKNRAALNAALGLEQAAVADAQAARMLLASSVVRSYFQLLRLDAQLAIAKRTLAQREQTRALVQDRVNAGLDTALELQQSSGALPEARLQMEMLQEQKQLAHNMLAALTSAPNRAASHTPLALFAIKNIALPTSMPLDLLARRPDIEAARQRARAASFEVDNAKAQFYPNINLVAFVGLNSFGFDKLLDTGSGQWGVGPALRLPLFDGGRLRANLRGKTADWDAAVESYNGVVLEALHDVADQLTSSHAIGKQQTEQTQAQTSAESAYAIATQRYEAGLGTYLQVLAAETAVLAQRKLAVDLQARALDTQAQLMRALGGGYQDARQ